MATYRLFNPGCPCCDSTSGSSGSSSGGSSGSSGSGSSGVSSGSSGSSGISGSSGSSGSGSSGSSGSGDFGSCGCASVRSATELHVSGTCSGTIPLIGFQKWGGQLSCGSCNIYVCVSCIAPIPTGTCGDYVYGVQCQSCDIIESVTCGGCDPPPDACSCSPFQLNICCLAFSSPQGCCSGLGINLQITL